MMFKTKQCANKDCGNTVFYDTTWTFIPNYCRNCKERYNAKKHPKNCSECGTPFMCHEDSGFTLCHSCYEKEHWAEKPCVECGTIIKYRKSWKNTPKRCDTCLETNRPFRKEKTCFGCDNTIIYYTNWETVPNYCPECRQARKEGRIEIECNHCRKIFIWNKLWQTEDEDYPDTCPSCQSNGFEEIIEAYPSKNSYSVNDTLEFYRMIGVLNHFIHGSSRTHIWTGEFEEKDPEFIITSAAQIAQTISSEILEFKSNPKGEKAKAFVIKYNIKTFQVVIIDPEENIIVTTYLLHQGLKTIVQKLNRHEWEKP